RRGDFREEWRHLHEASAFETREVKQFVFLDGAADGAAILIIDELGIRLRTICLPRVCLQVLVGVVFEQDSMDGISSALDGYVHGAATGLLLGIERVARHADI